MFLCGIFVPQKDEGLMRADYIRAEYNAFDQQMREFFHKETVFEGAGLAFVCIHHDILLASCSVTHDLPFQTGWKACASHAAEPAVFERLDHWRDIFACEQAA